MPPSEASGPPKNSAWLAPVRLAAAVVAYLLAALTLLLFLLSHLKLLIIRPAYKCLTGKDFEVLSGIDTFFQISGVTSFTADDCPMTVQVAAIVRGQPDLRALRQLVLDKLINARRAPGGVKVHPRLTKRVVRKCGYFVWTDDANFRIENNVRLHAHGYSDAGALVQIMQEIGGTPLPAGHSPWEFVIVPKVPASLTDPVGEYALVLRGHHSLLDGMHIQLMCMAIFDESPSMKFKDMITAVNMDKAAPLVKNNPLLGFLANRKQTLSLRDAGRVILNGLKLFFFAPLLLAKTPFFQRQKHAFHGPALSGRKLMAVSAPLDLKLFKDIGAAFDCRVNDVYLCGVTSSLQRYNEAGALPTDGHVWISTPMILLRPGASSWSQNCITFSLLDLPLRAKSATERLNAISAIGQKAKQSVDPIAAFLISEAVANHGPLPVARVLYESVHLPSMCTGVFGPSFEVAILGGQVTEMFSVPINCTDTGVSFILLSYNGRVRVGVTMDRAVTYNDRSAQQLADDFVDEIKHLHAMVPAHEKEPAKQA